MPFSEGPSQRAPSLAKSSPITTSIAQNSRRMRAQKGRLAMAAVSGMAGEGPLRAFKVKCCKLAVGRDSEQLKRFGNKNGQASQIRQPLR